MSRCADDRASSSAFEPRPKAASRSTRWSHSAPCSCHAQRGLERVAELAAGAGDALDELDGTAPDDVDGGQELEAGVGHVWLTRSVVG